MEVRDETPADGLLTIAETARRLGVCERQVRTFVAAGQLSQIVMGPRLIRYDPKQVDEFIEKRRRTVVLMPTLRRAAQQ